MPTLLNIAGTLVLTGLGWVVFEFVGRPVRDFFDLRRDAKRLMMVHWNLPMIASAVEISPAFGLTEDEWTKARSDFTDTGARLVSFDASEFLAARFVRLMGFNPRRAGAALLVIANELGTLHDDRAKNFATVERALKLKDR